MIITRFAPSPTGLLHLGHAHAALFADRCAKEENGLFLLRMEDIDPMRCREEFVSGIMTDLSWLGLSWPEPVRQQSRHMNDYQDALSVLDDLGVLYPCFCTRKDIMEEVSRAGHAPHGPDGALYPGICRHLSGAERQRRRATEAFALRLDMTRAIALSGPLSWYDRNKGWQKACPEIFGDVVLARKDTPCSYHLAVTVDDHLQGISLVTRGEDLFAATHIHCLLQALLGYPSPEYHHHALLLDEAGRRYAKRDRGLTLRSLRDTGKTPDDVRAMICMKIRKNRREKAAVFRSSADQDKF